jgi:DNA helicase-2/ATP-dependent DNA helicase PcrA
MTFPGPEALGRGLVVAPGVDLTGNLAAAQGWEQVRVDGSLLADESDGDGRLNEATERLHRAWSGRRRVLVELDLAVEQFAQLRQPEVVERAVYLLGAEFTLLRERLQFLLWRNNYDARRGEPVWWWALKAAGPGATPGGQADVVLGDGSEAWVDGGPRRPLDRSGLLDRPVVHAESIELGRLRLQPRPSGATGDGTLLAPDQRAAVEHPAGPVRVVAPAGSGKTRTLNARLLHLTDDRGVEPSLITAVAYNNRAAEEMRSRLQRPDLQIRTIHSLGWRIVRDVRPNAALLGEREVRDRLQRILPHTRQAGKDVFGPYIEALADVRIALRHPERVEAERGDVPGFAGVFETYRAGLAQRDECDFDEQVYEAIRLLLADPELRARWQGRCRHLLVDEFQDLTPAYMLLLRLLASPALNVFGVGDDDQTIYGYAGADPRFLLEYERLFPGAGEAALEVSYRCPPEVVTAVGHLLVNNQRRLPKTVRAASTGASLGGTAPREAGAPATGTPDPATSGGAHTPDPSTTGAFRILRIPDETMAAEVAKVVTGWRDEGVPDEDIVVLGRVNSMLLPALAALEEAGVEARSFLTTQFMHRNLVKATLAWMRLALRPDAMDPRDLNEAARRPGRRINRLARDLLEGAWGISPDQLRTLGAHLKDHQADAWAGFVADIDATNRVVAAGGDSRTLIEFLMNDVGLGRAANSLDSGRTRPDRAAHADDLLALRRTASIYSDPAGFHRSLASLLRRTSEEGDGVSLTTIHRVKGLEWDRVLVFGADEGLMPHHLATDTEEERRVLHVAVTRGQSQVVVLADAARPSRFVNELEGRPPQPRTQEPRPERTPLLEAIKGPIRRRKAQSGAEADDEPYDEALFETLREWRLEEARSQDVRAFHVFSNRVLKNIVRRRPVTPAELAGVSGVGPAKLAGYGEAVLAVIRAHGVSAGVSSDDDPPHSPASSTSAFESPSTTTTDPIPISGPPPTTPPDDEPYDEALFETLREWRLEESRRRKVPAHVVFDDRTLESIARRKPSTDFDLAAVSGVGPRKMADYAEPVLKIVRAHRGGG